MKPIDAVLIFGMVTVASCLVIRPGKVSGFLKAVIAFIVLLALIQFLMEGYYWHYVPGYLLLFVLIGRMIFSNNRISNTRSKILQSALVCLIIAAIAPWTIFQPVPNLIAPQGKYSLGTRIFRWVDVDRAELITTYPHDKRNVVVQAWYPTEEKAKGNHSDYLDGMDNLPEKIGILPRWIFNHYDQIDTYGLLNAPILRSQQKWPVVIFLTGNGASRAFYTSFITALASHGYVVLAIDHPYEAMITQLADGQIVTTIEKHLSDDPDLLKFMKARLDVRVADVAFVLNQIESVRGYSVSFLSSLDQNRIVVIGHSLGGATAAVAMASDSRIKAAVNVDGTMYGELPESNGPKPFLLIESKKNDSIKFERYENGNQQFFRHFGGGYRFEIMKADHYSFTDAPLLLALPTRFLTSHFLDFGNIPVKTHTASIEIINAFFYNVLNEASLDLDSVANRYPGINRKPIN